MIGVILAAGMAKRLRPLTDTKPKCLLEVGGKTLLQRTVDAMATAGINEFVVVTGYRGNMIRDFLTIHYPQFTIRFLDNVDYANNNNIYSLWMAGQIVRGQAFLLMDSDILCDPAAVVRIASEPEAALAVNRHELGEEEMKVVVDNQMRITEISKTCRRLRATHPPRSHLPCNRHHRLFLLRTRHPRRPPACPRTHACQPISSSFVCSAYYYYSQSVRTRWPTDRQNVSTSVGHGSLP